MTPWQFWTAPDIARITGCPLAAVEGNWPLLAAALDARGILDRDVCLGVLPTVAIETASTFAPVHEYGTPADWAGYEGGPQFAGRGYLQITHLSNYRAAGAALGVDLVGNPDLALDPKIAADILAWFWATKGVKAKDGSRWYSLVDLCHEHDWTWTRKVVQGGTAGLDRLIAMASALDAYASPKEPTVPTYTPSTPPQRQVQSWTCSIRATAWVLASLGIAVDIGALQDEMSPKYVTPEDGLKDARGYGVAATLKAHLPADWQDHVHVFEAITWDELRSLAGTGPIALGLEGAYHWLNVAGARAADGDLDAPNPAPNYPASGPIGDVLSRAEFDKYGPASAVFVNAAAAPVPAAPPAPAPSDELARLRAELADKTARLDAEVSKLGYISGDVATACDRVAEAATAIANTLRRLQPPAA